MAFGQFATHETGDRSKGYPPHANVYETAGRTYRLDQIMPPGSSNGKMRGGNAATFVDIDGWTCYKLHHTIIVKVRHGVVVVSTGGWHTPTTRSNIDFALSLLVGGTWYAWGDGVGATGLTHTGADLGTIRGKDTLTFRWKNGSPLTTCTGTTTV